MQGGVCGICSKTDCLARLYNMTLDLQDRGQEYCGLSTFNKEREGEPIKIRTHRGLVGPTFQNDLPGLEGNLGIGHTHSKERQPFPIYDEEGKILFTVGFDGYVTNHKELKTELRATGYSFTSNTQAELVAKLIAREKDITDGIEMMLQQIEGACSMVLLTKDGIYVARDPLGFKPLAVGQGDSVWAVASESCAFGINSGLDLVRDIEPGEIVFLNPDEISTIKRLGDGRKKICVFEWIYYANPNSVIEGRSVAEARHILDGFLAENDKVIANLVESGTDAEIRIGPVPNSGICHAEGYHLASGIPSVVVFLPLRREMGLRTYIIPDVGRRKKTKKKKLTPLRANVEGMIIILVDDSIRSGITIRDLVFLLKEAGAVQVHPRIGSPPSIRDCPWALPPKEGEGFIARDHTVEEIKESIGADSLMYQKLENVPKAVGLPKESLCLDCFLRE